MVIISRIAGIFSMSEIDEFKEEFRGREKRGEERRGERICDS